MTPTPFTFTVLHQGGYFFYDNGYVTIRTVPCGGFAWLQVRAWDARLGPTYESVVALGIGGYGESNIFYKQGGYLCFPDPSPPEPLFGLESFSLRPEVPEPSAGLFLLLGVTGFWLAHRRRQRK